MIGSEGDLFKQVITAANSWRQTALGAGVDLTAINVIMPDDRPLRLDWVEEAQDNHDGTFTADWVIRT